MSNDTVSSPAEISASVLDEVRRELNRYEENAEGGSTIQDAVADVIRRLREVYCSTSDGEG